MAVIAIVFAGCSTNNNYEHQHNSDGSHIDSEKVHKHEDGSTHQDHQGAEHHQEEFKVESDSTILQQDTDGGHSHEDGNHQH